MFKKTLLIVLSLMLIVSGTVLADDKVNPTPENPVTIRVGYQDRSTWPEGSGEQPIPDAQRAFTLIFEQIVESKTNGAVQVEHYPNSQFGNAKEMIEMVKGGTLDMCNITGPMGTFFPEYQLIFIPYVFEDPEVAHRVFNQSEFWADLMNQMEEEVGVKYLGMGQNGVRHFSSNEKLIRTPEDMEGQKIRVMQSPIFVKMVEALGANPVPIAWNELYTSLNTGVADGQENPLSTMYRGNLQEVQKYLTLDGHVWSDNLIIMNPKTYNKFPADIQQIIDQASRMGSRVDWAAEALSTKVIAYDALSEGLEEVYQPTPEEIQQFRETAQPPVIEWLEGEIGEDVVEDFLAAVKQAEEELGY